jgi:ADP-ribose pyrophosphatase
MRRYDDVECWRLYQALLAERPALFDNFGEGTEILLAPSDVADARAQARAHRAAHGLPADDTRIGVLADDPYGTLLREAVRFPDGAAGTYYRLLVPTSVVVLPLLGDDIILIRHFRHGTRLSHLEVPRGIGDGNPSWEDDVRRELGEEIGATASEIIPLGDLHPSNGIVSECMKLYAARIDATGAVDHHEGITEAVRLPVDRVTAMIKANEVTDGPTLACFLRARLHGII